MDYPITMQWDGEVMRPLARFGKECDRRYVVGETYPLEVHESRSSNTHRHYFAALNDAWANLPEAVAPQFPSVEHLRKWALIKAGICDTRDHVCGSDAEARALASFIEPIDSYAVVEVRGPVVRIHTAKSQSVRSMDKATFQDSKQKVLDAVANLIGVPVSELSAQAGQAA
jgi:hypothetical protein